MSQSSSTRVAAIIVLVSVASLLAVGGIGIRVEAPANGETSLSVTPARKVPGGGDLDQVGEGAGEGVPIQPLGKSEAETSFRMRTLARSAAGRSYVRLVCEVKLASIPFDGSGLLTGSWIRTGTPGSQGSTVDLERTVTGLSEGRLYRWRLRILSRSPFFPRSPWFSVPGNAITEADVRTSQATTAVAASEAPRTGAWIAGTPNPFRTTTELRYTVPVDGRVRVEVFDLLGRCIATLLAGEHQAAGSYALTWDGRDGDGRRLPGGRARGVLAAGALALYHPPLAARPEAVPGLPDILHFTHRQANAAGGVDSLVPSCRLDTFDGEAHRGSLSGSCLRASGCPCGAPRCACFPAGDGRRSAALP